MATFNELTVRLRCPKCKDEADMKVALYFGFRNQIEYVIGSKYEWRKSPFVKNGGRPPGGNLDGEGYVECPLCHRAYFVVVKVREDIIQSVEPDERKVIWPVEQE